MEHVQTFTKRDVAHRMAGRMNTTMHTSEVWTDQMFAVLREIVESADPELRIEIRNFGVLEVKLTKARSHARNPRTGEEIVIPARRKTHFKPGKGLRAFLRQPVHEPLATRPHAVRLNIQ